MWLVETSTLRLEDFHGTNIPYYAILSHTWTKDEVLFHEIQDQPIRESIKNKTGFRKMTTFCELARRYGYRYAWIDTCCIDKRSSAELTEAINSMYKYYCDAEICMVYLADVPGTTEGGPRLRDFQRSLWFTRGWTLQELIASKRRIFFSRDWETIPDRVFAEGNSDRQADLVDQMSGITGIDQRVLRDHSKLTRFCVAERMSWASRRQTTRPEDAAYSLMGLFKVNMGVLYGEGLQNAFARLQGEIMKTSFDQTIFAWRGPYESSGLLAHTPADFANTPRLRLWKPNALVPFNMTNVGLNVQLHTYNTQLIPGDPGTATSLALLQCYFWNGKIWEYLLLRVKEVDDAICWLNGAQYKAFRRVDCDTWEERDVYNWDAYNGKPDFDDVFVLEDAHYDLVKMNMELYHMNTL